ncbi:MAG: MerR family DNA-binding transcriptional regulator [Jatrophihabitans sp.]|uniref:helix-turn-helix domain-containing protein n=1 Tax=Jatrophihabitans sp. TaxID=1932789 RepID=UPI00391048EA
MEGSGAGLRPGGLSIGDVARLAGVSTRAVRHYHAIGLLAEPERDSSDYRRYGSKDVIALVRVVRLRAAGMPLPKIAERLVGAEVGDGSLSRALRDLADEMDGEIAALAATRDGLRSLAESETFDQPVKALTDALRGHGLLGPSDELRAGEGWAAALLDALHPQGMSGVLDQASGLLTDPARLAVLLQRFRNLNKKADADEIDALADEVAALLPQAEPGAALVDIDLMDKLLTERLNQAQQRFLRRLRDQRPQVRL